MNQETIIVHYLGVIAVVIIVFLGLVSFVSVGKHADDKAYRLCMTGITTNTLAWDAENGCLEKYGVQIKDTDR